jgi:hypothetical protein
MMCSSRTCEWWLSYSTWSSHSAAVIASSVIRIDLSLARWLLTLWGIESYSRNSLWTIMRGRDRSFADSQISIICRYRLLFSSIAIIKVFITGLLTQSTSAWVSGLLIGKWFSDGKWGWSYCIIAFNSFLGQRLIILWSTLILVASVWIWCIQSWLPLACCVTLHMLVACLRWGSLHCEWCLIWRSSNPCLLRDKMLILQTSSQLSRGNVLSLWLGLLFIPPKRLLMFKGVCTLRYYLFYNGTSISAKTSFSFAYWWAAAPAVIPRKLIFLRILLSNCSWSDLSWVLRSTTHVSLWAGCLSTLSLAWSSYYLIITCILSDLARQVSRDRGLRSWLGVPLKLQLLWRQLAVNVMLQILDLRDILVLNGV